MATALPVIRGTSAALYPFILTISFQTIMGRFQNGSEQRYVGNSAGLISFELFYATLTQAQKNTIKAAVTAAKGQQATNLTLTMGSTTYTNLSLDSDEFAGTERLTTQYAAPLKVSQTVPQNFSPGSPGGAFPTLANGSMGILPYTQRKVFQTMSSKVNAGPKFTSPEFGGGLTGYPADGLMGWILEEKMLSDADLATRMNHFIVNFGQAFSFPFTDEDGTTYSHANGNGSPRYSSDSLTFRYNGVNNSDVTIGIELTNN